MYLDRIGNNKKDQLTKVLKILENEHQIVLDFNDMETVELAESIALENIEVIKDSTVSVFEETNKHLAPSYLVVEAVKLYREINMKKLNEESEIQKAEYLLASKNIVDELQKMLEKLSDMQAQQIPAIVDKMKLDAGIAAADNYKNAASSMISSVIDSINTTKEGMDNLTLGLSGDVDMASAMNPEDQSEVDNGEMEEVPEEPNTSNPLGRERKDESKKKFGKALTETKKWHVTVEEPAKKLTIAKKTIEANSFAEASDKMKKSIMMQKGLSAWNDDYEIFVKPIKESKEEINDDGLKVWHVQAKAPEGGKLYGNFRTYAPTKGYAIAKAKKAVEKKHGTIEVVFTIKEMNKDQVVKESWKMDTKEKDKGKWEGWTKAQLQAELKKLKNKKDHSATDTKTIRQIEFALRAKGKGQKHTGKWGKVDESVAPGRVEEIKDLAKKINAIKANDEYADVMRELGFFVDEDEKFDDKFVFDALSVAPDEMITKLEKEYGKLQHESVDEPNTFADDVCVRCNCEPCECMLEDADDSCPDCETEPCECVISEDEVDDAIARVQHKSGVYSTKPFEFARAIKDIAKDLVKMRGMREIDALRKAYDDAVPTLKAHGINLDQVKGFLKLDQVTESKKCNRAEAMKVDKSTYAEEDEETGSWTVFGDNSGFAYAQGKDKEDAEQQSMEMTKRLRKLNEAPNSAQTITAQQKAMPSMFKASPANMPAQKPTVSSTTPTKNPVISAKTYKQGDAVTVGGKKVMIASDKGDMVGVQDTASGPIRMVSKNEVQDVAESKEIDHDASKCGVKNCPDCWKLSLRDEDNKPLFITKKKTEENVKNARKIRMTVETIKGKKGAKTFTCEADAKAWLNTHGHKVKSVKLDEAADTDSQGDNTGARFKVLYREDGIKKSNIYHAKDKEEAIELCKKLSDSSDIKIITAKQISENASVGATSAGSIAALPKPLGMIQRRKPVEEDFHDDQVAKIYKLKTTNPVAWEAKCKELGISTKSGKNEIAVALVKKK